MNVPQVVARHVARDARLHLGLTSKILWMGGPDTGKTTHAKRVSLMYPKGAVWDPNHEWDARFCARHGWAVARSIEGLEKAARISSRVVLQVKKREEGDEEDAYADARRELGNRFAWWVLRNLKGPCFVYFDEPHTVFRKNNLPSGMAELLRRGHKDAHRLAMGWSCWGAREMPNDLENVSHVVAFRPGERNDVDRADAYFGRGWSEVAEALPDYWHMVRQKDPTTRTMRREVFPPVPKEV